MADQYRQLQVAVRLIGLMLGLVILSAILLSAAGIYALMVFTVAQRRREVGIRSALGGHPRRILGGIFSRAVRQLAIGLAAGLLDAAGGRDLIRGRGDRPEALREE